VAPVENHHVDSRLAQCDGAGNTFKATAKPVLIGTAVVGSTTMIFGIIFGTFLTLVLVPVLYWQLAKFNERVARWRKRITPAEHAPVVE